MKRLLETHISAYEIIMLVHELHQRGYEQLRLLPGMSASGCYWRWSIYPKILMWDNDIMEHHNDYIPFKCMDGSTDFEYPRADMPKVSVEDFIRGNENFIELSKAKDEEYVRWFSQIVEHAARKDFPIAYSEWFQAEEWKFLSGEPLRYPPFTRAKIDEISPKAMEWARENGLF